MNPRPRKHNERGIALLLALLALLLLTAIAASLIFMSNMETAVDANYRDEQVAYYAGRGGVQEVHDRMRLAGADAIANNLPTEATPVGSTGAPAGVLYMINQGSDPTVVAPWTLGTAYADDELCREYPGAGGMGGIPPLGQRCTTLPAGNWYTNPAPTSELTAGVAALAGNPAAAMSYKWVRVTIKQNSSVPPYQVNAGGNATDSVCYDGYNEFSVPAGTLCSSQAPHGTAGEPVYLVTALAVTRSGARRMVQSEISKVLFPGVPATLTLDGPSAGFSPPSSAGFTITGCDYGTGLVPNGNACKCDASRAFTTDPASTPQHLICDPPATPPVASCPNSTPESGGKPALGTFTDADAAAVNSSTSGRSSNYSGAPITATTPANNGFTGPPADCGGSGSGTFCPSQYTQNVDSVLGGLSTVSGLNQLVSNLSQVADQTISSGGSASTLGTYNTSTGQCTTPLITVAQGDLSLSPGSVGCGILVVQGTLTLRGSFAFHGLVLVIGTGALVQHGGGGGLTISGGMLVANTTPPIVNDKPNTPSFTLTGGGSTTVQYDSCDINAANKKDTFHTIAWREISY